MPSGLGARIRSVYAPGAIPAWILGHVANVYSIRADYVSTVSFAGTRVVSAIDQSGHGNHWTQNPDASAPTLEVAAVNGLPAMRGIGDGGLVSLTNTSIGTSLTQAEVFIVAQRLSGNGALWRFGTDNLNPDYVPYATDSKMYDGFGTDSRTGPSAASFMTLTASPFVYNVRTSAGAWSSVMNGGTAVYSRASNTVSFRATKILFGTADHRLDGYIAESHMFSALLSTEERADMNAYLMGRYGIA
jgi:hypothetical protein